MNQPVLIKVYGNFWPYGEIYFNQLISVRNQLQTFDPVENQITCENGLLLISYEGIFFPVDEVLRILENWLGALDQIEPTGKLDVIDIEHWTLSRYIPQNGKLILKQSPLNNVLDYSGH